jgi:hypothetical protein
MVRRYGIKVEWDGCCNGPFVFKGTERECIEWMTLNWDNWARKQGWREDFADGFALIDLESGRCRSFVLDPSKYE